MPARERPGDRVTRGGGEDRRVAIRPRKLGAVRGSMGQLAWETCRMLVQAATRGYDSGAAMNKAMIADELGTTPGTLNRMMSPGDELSFKAEHLLILIACELVPEAARFQVMSVLAREAGGVFTPQADAAAPRVGLTRAALDLSSSSGHVADLVCRAVAADSDGGVKVTPREREQIQEAASRSQMAAGQVVQAAAK